MAAGAFVVGYIAVAWSIYFLYCRFQLVQTQAIDFLMLAVLALGIPLFFAIRNASNEGRSPFDLLGRAVSRKRLIGGILLTAAIGGAALRTVNALFDWHPAQQFAATIDSGYCKGCLALRGAPKVPTSDNGMRIEIFALENTWLHSRAGDTVIVSVKPGLLGRPWISGYAVHPLPDVAQQALARHRALLDRLRAQARLDSTRRH